MGKGDIKTRRGKITSGSYGVSRKRKKDQVDTRKFLDKVETTGTGSADEALKEAKTKSVKSPAKKTTAATKVKKVPEEMKKVPKKTTTAKKAAPKK